MGAPELVGARGPVQACVRAALEEQNAFDVLLWHWIQERLEASLDAFSRGRAAIIVITLDTSHLLRGMCF